MKSKRLGRGLEALIPQVPEEERIKYKERLFEVEVNRIDANPFQPRSGFDRKGLEDLKNSILENGVIQPITVRRNGDRFELIAGERRLRAVKELGYSVIPAFVMDVKSDDQMLELALVENIQREDLNPIELAKAYQKLQKDYNLTQEMVARKVGKDRATVANFIRLLKLPPEIQESLRKGEISMGHARSLMGISNPKEIRGLWKKIVKRGWSVRRVEEEVRRIAKSEEGGRKEAGQKSPYLIELEERICSIFGTQVKIRPMGKKGKIEISYYSDDDLDRIIELLNRAAD